MHARSWLTVLAAAAAMLSLRAEPSPAQESVVVTLAGTVTDLETAEPVPAVIVNVNGRTIALSDEHGAFRVPGVRVHGAAENVLSVHRIGYEPWEVRFPMEADRRELEFDIALRPLAYQLPAILTEVERDLLADRRLQGFRERRDAGFGHFFTYRDLEVINPQYLSEVVRRVPGVFVSIGGAPIGVDAEGRMIGAETNIIMHRGGAGAGAPGTGRECAPNVFVDGLRVRSTDLDLMTTPDRVVGMEVYTSIADVPPEYNVGNSRCGVIVVWTAESWERPSPFEIGLHAGANLNANGFAAGRMGIQLVISLASWLEVGPAFSFIANDPGPLAASSDSEFQALLSLRARPFGGDTPLYGGMGVTVIGRAGGGGGTEELRVHPLLLGGLSVPIGPLRPFVEAHVLDLAVRPEHPVYLFGGLNVRVR